MHCYAYNRLLKMKKYAFLSFLFCAFSTVLAQTTKPDVLVIGNGNAAVAAAIQAAQSNVKTTLLLQAGGFDIAPIADDIHSGFQALFLKKMRAHLHVADSLSFAFTKQDANAMLTKLVDSIKNLTVVKDAQWVKASKAGNGWSVTIANGKKIRAEILVATEDQRLSATLKLQPIEKNSWQPASYDKVIYKTAVAAGKLIDGNRATTYTLNNFINAAQDNIVLLTDQNSMLHGQAAGAVAAYAGFFDVKLSQANLKRIQGELVAFKTNLIAFADVAITDPNWRAIQLVGITGLLKGKLVNNTLHFEADKIVFAEEIKAQMKAHFYKAQIWFDDYKAEQLTVAAALDMINYVGNKYPETTLKEVTRKWNTTYKLTSAFNLDKAITKRELAILLQDYLPPFNVTLDKLGNIMR